ncbi:MAG: hypothetical protein ACI4RA_11645 [Kiritimatiellia bacterium]
MNARRRRQPEQTLFAFAEARDERRGGMDELFAALAAYRKGARFLRLLALAARFRAYGPYNALLAAVQRPNATCILPASKWRRYGREVKREARPIILLRPFSPITCVFDLADTRVMRGREDRLPERLTAPLGREALGPVPGDVVRRLVARLPWWGILHETVPTGPAAAGEIHLADGHGTEMAVAVRRGAVVACRPVYVLRTRARVGATDLFAALVRALARLFCHHLRCGYAAGWGDGRALAPSVEAFEAEVVLWLVSRRLGVASPAYAAVEDYFAEHAEMPEASMDAVLDAVAEIEKMFSAACTVRDGALFKLEPGFAGRVRAGDADDLETRILQQEILKT